MQTSTLKSPRAHNTKSKSPARQMIKSPLKKVQSFIHKKPKTDDMNAEFQMQKMRKKADQIIDSCVMIFQAQSPMRCLQHNSVLSLYCETQQKLLCANCIFKNGAHKLHKVLPVQKCYKQIARDIDLMTRQSEREMSWVQNTMKAVHKYMQNQQQNANNAILALARQYDQMQADLILSFEQAKRKIRITFDEIVRHKEGIMRELALFMDTIQGQKPLTWDNLQSIQKSKTAICENRLIYDHLIANALIDYGKVESLKIVSQTSKIEQAEKKQLMLIQQLRGFLRRSKDANGKDISFTKSY